MKEKLTNNMGLKLLSLILATILWLGVINSQDPIETVTFDDVPVTITNEGSLTAKDKIPEVVEGDTISVVVEARRSICDKLTKKDIIAIADFEKISVTDAVPIEVSVYGYTDREVEIVRGTNKMMKLRLEDSVSKDFRVKISTTGKTAAGHAIGDMIASPNMITLTGSSTQIGKIKEVLLVVNIDGMAMDTQTKGVPIVYDMNGDIVNSEKLTMSTHEVTVTVPVLKTKTMKIVVEPIGEPAPGYEIDTVSYQPESVTVAGSATDLLLLGTTFHAYCDITDATDVVEENIDISTLWNKELDSIRLVDEEKLAITITLKEFEEKELEITEKSIEIRNVPNGLDVRIKKISAHQVSVKGNAARMEELTIQTLAPYIDLMEYSEPGTYQVLICFDEIEGLLMGENIMAEVELSVTKAPLTAE